MNGFSCLMVKSSLIALMLLCSFFSAALASNEGNLSSGTDSGMVHDGQLRQRLIGLIPQNGRMQRVLVELAVTPEEWELGLMGRTSLGDDEGMLFDFGAERSISMWMKDTPLSLDMLFINDQGKIVAIAQETVPYSEAIITAPRPVRYVLEVKAGQAAIWGVKVGSDMVQISR